MSLSVKIPTVSPASVLAGSSAPAADAGIRSVNMGRTVSRRGGQFGFDAAEVNRLNKDWRTSSVSVNHDLRNAIATVRDRARDLANNDGYAKNYLRQLKANVVGPYGFAARINPAERDKAFRQKAYDVRQRFYEWMEPDHCTLAGDRSFVDIQNLAVTSAGRDGEMAYRIIRNKSLKFGFALLPVQHELLDETYTEVLPGDRVVVLGVEYDRKTMRRLAYWFRDIPVQSQIYGLLNVGERYRIPAEELIFEFDDEYVNQARGISWMVQSMSDMRMLSKMEEATLVAARMRAMIGGFLKRVNNNMAAGYQGDGETPDGDFEMALENGVWKDLPPGYDIASPDTNFPAGVYPDFVMRNLQKQAAALGVAGSVHSGNYSDVNFSSERARQIAVRDNYMLIQEWFTRRFLNRVARIFMQEAQLTGALNIPLRDAERLTKVVWAGKRWAYVNPEQEVNANAMKFKMLQKSISQMINESDDQYEPEEVFAMIAQDMALAKEHGLQIVTDVKQPSAPPADAPGTPAQNGLHMFTTNGKKNGHHLPEEVLQ